MTKLEIYLPYGPFTSTPYIFELDDDTLKKGFNVPVMCPYVETETTEQLKETGAPGAEFGFGYIKISKEE